jgi:hypothetical protein
MSRDYLSALRADPEKEPTQATAKTAISPADALKAATQGTAKTAKRAFGSNDSSEGRRFSEIKGVPAAVAEFVRCADCGHFRPTGVQQLGHCDAGAPEPPAGLWATDPRSCESWLPTGLEDGVRQMAERWGYSPDELEWALERATQHPAEWLGLIEADLQGRRWPGGEG